MNKLLNNIYINICTKMKKLLFFIVSIISSISFTFAFHQPQVNENMTRQNLNSTTSFYTEDMCVDWQTFYQTYHNYVWDSFVIADMHYWPAETYAYIYDKDDSKVIVVDPYSVFNFNNNFKFKSNWKPTWVNTVIFVQNSWYFKTWNLLTSQPSTNWSVLIWQIVFHLNRKRYNNAWWLWWHFNISYFPYPSWPQSTAEINHYYEWNEQGWYECFNYIVHYCWDWVVDTQASMAALWKANSVANEQCDPYAPWRSTETCSNTCKIIQQEDPQCHSQYNWKTTYTTNWNPLLNSSSSYLCAEWSPANFTGTWTFWTWRHFTWQCTVPWKTPVNCSANQIWCWDGQINNWSEVCEKYSETWRGWCNNNCTLMQPECIYNLTATPNWQPAPQTVEINKSYIDPNDPHYQEGWARLTILYFGDWQYYWNGRDVISFPRNHLYDSAWVFTITWVVKNLNVVVASGVQKPEAYCTTTVTLTTPAPQCWNEILETWEQCEKVNGAFLPWCENCHLQKPTCSVFVNPDHWNVPQQVEVTNNMPSWATTVYLNMWGWSSNIYNPTFPYYHTYSNAGSYQIKLKVRNNYDQYWVPYNGNLESEDFIARCYAYFTGTTPPPAPYCWDGNLDEWEQCDPGTWNFWNWCNNNCQLTVPNCTLTVDPNQWTKPLTTTITATKPDWAIYKSLSYGDNTASTTYPTFPRDHTYNQVWTFNLTLTVQNNYNGQINGTKPTATCSANVNVINPWSPTPYMLKQQTTWTFFNNNSLTTQNVYVQWWDIIWYKINFGNSGNVAATWEVRDILPTCVQYITSSITFSQNNISSNGPITWNNGWRTEVRYKDFFLQPWQGWYMLIKWQISTAWGMCAHITSYLNTWYFTLWWVTISGDVLAIRPTWPEPQPYLSIVKEQLTTWNLPAWSIVTYKITVTNTWSATATGVEIYDLLPKELTYISSNISIVPSSTYSFLTGTIGLGTNQRTYIKYYNITLSSNWTAIVYVTWKVKNGYSFDTLTNCASVSWFNIPQQNSCTTWTPPTPPTTWLSIIKELLTAWDLTPWSTIAYKITLTNTWSEVYHNAYIEDVWPNALNYQTSSIVWVPSNDYSFMSWIDSHWFLRIKYYDFDINPHTSVIIYLTWTLKDNYNFDETTNCAYTEGDYDCTLLPLSPKPFIQKRQTLWNNPSLNSNRTTGTLNVELWNYISYKIDFWNIWSVWKTGEVRDILPHCVQYENAWLVNAEWDWPTYNQNTNIVWFTNIYLTAWQRAYMMVVWKIRSDGDCQGVYEYLNTWEFHFIWGKWLKSTVLAVRPEWPTTDVFIEKTVDLTIVKPWDTVTYTITYKNLWPDTLTEYSIIDNWPSTRIRYVDSSSPWQRTSFENGWNTLTRVYNNQNFAPWETRTITVIWEVLP